MRLARVLLKLDHLEDRCVPTTIDATWLATHGGQNGPWHLTAAGGPYYDLATNVDAPGTAFIVDDPNVTLDLHGYTIKYGDSAPIAVPNGGFEDDPVGTTHPSHWDVSGASTAIVRSTSTIRQIHGPNAMYGNNMLEVTVSPTIGSQTIKSDVITLPNVSYEYTATITPKTETDGVTIQLGVYDLDTQTYLPLGPAGVSSNTGYEAQVARGYSPKASFDISPITGMSARHVRLEATVRPNGNTATVDLDYAAVLPSRDHGVLAIGGYWDLPVQIGGSSRYHANTFTLKSDLGSQILQGQANGYASSPIALFGSENFTVTGVNPDRYLESVPKGGNCI